MEKLIIHTDGGSRGNPGPAAAGVVIEGAGTGKKEFGEYIGETTNNEAEYRAVILAFKKAKQLLGAKAGETVLEFYADSELVVKQLSGEYKIKDKNIKDFFMEIWNLRMDFKSAVFKYIPREKNKDADRIVNQFLDKEVSKLNI